MIIRVRSNSVKSVLSTIRKNGDSKNPPKRLLNVVV